MKKGYITGAEYSSISDTNRLSIRIIGAEDPLLYKSNFKIFRNVLDNYPETDLWLNSLSDYLNNTGKRILNESLFLLVNSFSAFKNSSLSFYDMLAILTRNCDITNYPNIKLYSEIVQKKKALNIDNIESEKEILLQVLKENLENDDLARLVKASLEFKLEKISLSTFLEFLKESANKAYLSFASDYPSLALMLELHVLQSSINSTGFNDEITHLYERRISEFLNNDSEKES